MSHPTADPTVTADALAPGTLIAGKFRLERLLGEGGIGLVYAATHLELDERVALKFMRAEMMQNADIVERFAQEARAAAKLKTEHVARVLDVGKHGSTPFMVIELLQGRDMQRVVIDEGPMNIELAVELTIQACEALSEAHGRGIVHRDVKPENLFVVERDGLQHLKVLDFGISKVALSGKVSDVDLTSRRTMSIMGSPYYMSPEQIRSTRDVDHRADIWSLGASLFESLTARTAFPDGRQFTELMFDIVETPHRRLREFRPDVPPGLEAVIDRCLAKQREHRFQSAGALAVALLPFTRSRARAVAERAVTLTRSSGLDVVITMPPTLPPPTSMDPGSLDSTSLPALRPPSVPRLATDAPASDPVSEARLPVDAPPRKSRAIWIGVGGLLLLLGTAGALLLGRSAPTAPPPAERLAIAAPEAARPVASAAPAVEAEAAPSHAAAAEPTTAKRTAPVRPSIPAKAPSRTPSPSNPDLEIRRER